MMPGAPDSRANLTPPTPRKDMVAVDQVNDNPMYIAAHSPHESDAAGGVVCTVGSEYPWSTTESTFNSV